MQYEVQVVDDGDLPDGRDLVIVERGCDLPAVLIMSGRAAKVWRAMRDWEANVDHPDLSILLYAV